MVGKFHLHWVAFLVSFAIMMGYVYVVTPLPKIITKFPTPYNAGKIVYQDAAGTCFVFDAIEVTPCPKNKNVKKQPLVEKFINRIVRR